MKIITDSFLKALDDLADLLPKGKLMMGHSPSPDSDGAFVVFSENGQLFASADSVAAKIISIMDRDTIKALIKEVLASREREGVVYAKSCSDVPLRDGMMIVAPSTRFDKSTEDGREDPE